ncbi:hypothetical protein GCM10023185_10290 [Hymenobacter saemangeumensis]|uniref:Uncharacterized protein n=1 Tax=Hymenobacter saemangeumensis TaxID=1084522 RepID=A0ABP8I5K2_9BACT
MKRAFTILKASYLVSACLLAQPARAQTATPAPLGEAADPQGGTSGHELVLCTDGSVMGWGYNGGATGQSYGWQHDCHTYSDFIG